MLNKTLRKTPRVVPVANRAQKKRGFAVAKPRLNMNARQLAVLIGVVILVLLLVGTPLRNYLHQRSEIARVTAAIAEKEQQKADLQEEIAKYESESFVREQARTRLGVIEPGEIAFRVVDPVSPENDPEHEGGAGGIDRSGPWFEVLWNSVSTPEYVSPPPVVEAPEHHLPIAPAP